jgi:bifunctional aspartokinase / homoserine dehydrogenase 1
MGKTLVMKFGGTSVGQAAAIRSVVEIVKQVRAAGEWARVVVVVSAMSKVTDKLLAGAQAAAHGEAAQADQLAAEIWTQHQAALGELAPQASDAEEAIAAYLDEFAALCHAISILGEASARALDAVASLGERMSAPLVAAALTQAGVAACAVDSSELVVTDAVYQAASPDMAATQARVEAHLGPICAAGQVPVVTGFIGATPEGVVTTLGRGGSDFSAAILGVALAADEVWIWTDVDGVMTADPRIVPEAHTLPDLMFREMSELAFYGAKVLHPKTIRPVIERKIALWVKNTFNPAHPGTRILPDNGVTHGVIRAVTAFKGQQMITVEGRGMLGIPGIAARTFAAVARTGTSVAMISQASSEQSICFSVPQASVPAVTHALEDEFHRELARRDIDRITASEEFAIVTVVGAGMRHTPGIAGRVFGVLGASGVNVIAIAQGSSECNISLMVAAGEADAAMRAIHSLIE